MTKTQLMSYQANERLIMRYKEKMEEESLKERTSVAGSMKGSCKEFPYIEHGFTVSMEDSEERAASDKKTALWNREIEKAQKKNEEIRDFIAQIEDDRIKEIIQCRFIDGMKLMEIGDRLCYTKGRISQIINKFLKD